MLAPQSAPLGEGAPEAPIPVLSKAADGGSNVELPQLQIGSFVFPGINASLPAKGDVTPVVPHVTGRRLLAQPWQVGRLSHPLGLLPFCISKHH